MTDRERLVEKLNIAHRRNWQLRGLKEYWEFIADYLLDHGVIILPCKVGDTVYKILDAEWDVGEFVVYNTHYIHNVHKIIRYDAKYHSHEDIDDVSFYDDEIGKTVFLTREEAEEALKSRDNNG